MATELVYNKLRLKQISALLLLCHVVETVSGVWLTNQLWRNGETKPLVVMATILIASTCVTALVSLVLVSRQLKFGDRLAGKCLCYLLHVVGGCMFWRVCKVLLAFDGGDVKELAVLRHLSIYIQTLPICVIQLYTSYCRPNGLEVPDAVILVLLMTSIATSSVLHSSIQAQNQQTSTISQSQNSAVEFDSDDVWCHLLVAIQTISLMWSRMTATAVVASLWLQWIAFILLIQYFGTVAVLLVIQKHDSAEKSTVGRVVSVLTMAYSSLYEWQEVWQWLGAVSTSSKRKSQVTAVYYLLIGLESGVFLCLWTLHGTHASHLKLATAAASVATFCVGVVIATLMHCFSPLAPAENINTTVKEEVPSPRPLDPQSVTNVYTSEPASNLPPAISTAVGYQSDSHSANSRNTNTLPEADFTHPHMFPLNTPIHKHLAGYSPASDHNLVQEVERSRSNLVRDTSVEAREYSKQVSPISGYMSECCSRRIQKSIRVGRPPSTVIGTPTPVVTIGKLLAHVHINQPAVSEAPVTVKSCRSDGESLHSHSTYSTWPPRARGTCDTVLARLLPPQVTPAQYVHAWLQSSTEPYHPHRPPPLPPRKLSCKSDHCATYLDRVKMPHTSQDKEGGVYRAEMEYRSKSERRSTGVGRDRNERSLTSGNIGLFVNPNKIVRDMFINVEAVV